LRLLVAKSFKPLIERPLPWSLLVDGQVEHGTSVA
jgi:hypothetical protein